MMQQQKENNDKAVKLEQDKADALERIRQGEIDTEEERRAEELRQVQKQYADLIAEANKYGQDTTLLKEAQRTKEKELTDKFALEDAEKKLAADEKLKAEAQKRLDEEKLISDKKVEIARAEAEQKAALQMLALNTAGQGVALIKSLFEKSKGVQKAAMIAESAIGIGKMLIANNTANIAALATPQAIATSGAAAIPTIAFNNISTGIGIAANIAATAKALSSLGGGGGGASAGGAAVGGSPSPPPAPQFNVVGNSGVNQVAATLGQQQPVQAFVVANQVTTQQSLDRNIINNASIG